MDKDVEWPTGYCLDPNGRMCVPYGQDVAWNFGYEIGFREAMDIKMRAVLPARAAVNDEIANDAKRYQWLRANAYIELGSGISEDWPPGDLERLIDAQMKRRALKTPNPISGAILRPYPG